MGIKISQSRMKAILISVGKGTTTCEGTGAGVVAAHQVPHPLGDTLSLVPRGVQKRHNRTTWTHGRLLLVGKLLSKNSMFYIR